MKCREKNSEKTFLKIDNIEKFWEKLKETKVRVIQISESGIIVSDGLCKYYAEFGEYLLVSNEGYIEVCGEDEFNRRYEVVGTYEADIFDEKIKDMRKYVEVLTDRVKSLISEALKI